MLTDGSALLGAMDWRGIGSDIGFAAGPWQEAPPADRGRRAFEIDDPQIDDGRLGLAVERAVALDRVSLFSGGSGYGRAPDFDDPTIVATPMTGIAPAVEMSPSPWPLITTTGSSMEVFTVGEVTPVDAGFDLSSNASAPLVNLDDFRADLRFADIDGSGFASVILDTGIDLDHAFFGPDADGNGIADRIVYQYDFADGDANASDVNGHGSNVSSIIGSQDSLYGGMAPGADIIALKVFKDSGAGYFSYIENALQWVVNNAAAYNIVSVNMSLGDSGNYNVPVQQYGIADEMAALAAMNVAVVSASGNSFYSFNSVQGVSYPSADPYSLSVGAVYDGYSGGWSYGSGAIAYTTGADHITPFSQRDDQLTDVFAPGAPITGAGATGGLVTMHGTSQASPHVAGIVVLAQQLAVQELGRKLTFAEISDLIRTTGVTINDGDDESGNVTNTNLDYSRIDVLALGEAIYAMGDGPNLIDGTELGEVLTGTEDNDLLMGLGGDDTLLGRGGDDTLQGGEGNDRLDGAVAGDAQGTDVLDGGAGDDLLIADLSDTVLGGKGTDTLVVRTDSLAPTGAGVAGISIRVDNAHADVENVFGGANDDIIDGSAVGAERLTLRGSDGNDVITGGAYRDKLYGGDDDDTLSGGDEADYLKGENGNDWLSGGAGNDHLRGGSGEDLVAGGDGNDILYGGADDDTLEGGSGNDRLNGADVGDDQGADLLDGGQGDDRIYADASDTVMAGDGHDQLYARGTTGLSADLAAMQIEETWGGDFADLFDGSGVVAESLLLRGGAGNDQLIGGALNDRLYGGDDDDILQGGGSNDYLKGENGADVLLGGEGNDRLRGGADADTLDGGLGKDALSGDGGADVFANTGGDGVVDNVTDYSAAEGDSILHGASYVFNGFNTYVYDAGGTMILRLNGYDADTNGILFV